MSLYLDASALTKLVLEEAHTQALSDALGDRPIASSELVVTEVPRAVHRRARRMDRAALEELLARASRVLSRVTLLPLERATLETAGRISEPDLRPLDAIHVASALIAGDDLAAFVTYDRRQGQVATKAGFEVLAPGT